MLEIGTVLIFGFFGLGAGTDDDLTWDPVADAVTQGMMTYGTGQRP